jgi:hypothetical protein
LFAAGAFDWATAPIQAMLVNYLYAPSLADQHVSDIPADAVIVRDVPLTGVGQSNGVCYGNIPQFNALLSAFPVAALVLYASTGVDTTSLLVYYTSSGPGFPFAAQGLNYFVGFDSAQGGWFQV